MAVSTIFLRAEHTITQDEHCIFDINIHFNTNKCAEKVIIPFLQSKSRHVSEFKVKAAMIFEKVETLEFIY